jgi:eukaryotic-like serine/threonine-protein kinase
MQVSPDRWKRIEALFHESLELQPAARAAFLDESCGADTQLREEIEALLKEAEATIGPLRQCIVEAAHHLADGAMTLVPGTGIRHYQIVSLLATGGMGQVYLAEDATLKRKVAIKVLAPPYTRDEGGLLRFEREAQAASALNHPNIVTIHECGQVDDLHFIVSEFVDGSTLRQKLSNGRLALNTILDIAIQIAGALDAAHSAGIIHRDIKPENVMVRNDGLVKILDFGIAKLSRAPALGQTTDARSTSLTQPGMLIGTVAYMSPEQATGKELDLRTDLFSFGAVLYEMATGSAPFPGENAGAVIERMLTQPPIAPLRLNPDIPAKLEDILSRALQKDRTVRYQQAAEMRSDLLQLKQVSDQDVQPSVSARQPATAGASGRLWWITVAAIVLAIALIAGYFVSRRLPKLTDKDTVVVADFRNSTGDDVFDDTLKTALTIALNQSPFLDVLSDNKIAAALKLMTRPVNTKLTPDVARELCLRAGSKAYIAGSIGNLGDEYVLGLKAVNCQSGEPLDQEQVTANGKEKVLNALGDATAKLRAQLGESLASLQKFDVPLQEATTSSLEALQAYSMAIKIYQEKGPDKALIYDQRAIQLDPTFAMGYHAVAGDYHDLGESGRASEYFAKAFELRPHASERERLIIRGDYYLYVTGELDKAAQTNEQLIENYPRYSPGYIGLGSVYGFQGEYLKAVKGMRQAQQLRPESLTPYGDLANYLLALQRFDEARETIREGRERKLDDFIFHVELYGLAFLADSSARTQEQQWFADHAAMETYGLSLDSDSEAYRGRLGKARELTKQAVDSAMRADSKETGAIWWENSALREAAFGNSSQATQAAAEGSKLYPASQGVQVEAALAYAMAGDTARAESTAQNLNQRYSLDTQVQSLWLPAIQGQVALTRKAPAEAIEHLQLASPPIEYGQIVFISQISCLYPTYVRGQAYLAAGKGKEAVDEFQKILDHSGTVWNCWTGALAHLGVARANALQARFLQGADADAARVRALAAYKDFLALWKDADPDIPVYKNAKAEYAKLR